MTTIIPSEEIQKEVEQMFRDAGAFRDGHFTLTSGNHSGFYVAKDLVYRDPVKVAQLTKFWFDLIPNKADIEVIIGPAVGAALLGQWTGYQFNTNGFSTIAGWADKGKGDGGSDTLVLKRGFDKDVKGKKVLLVEDILNTGSSIKKTMELIAQNAGTVVTCAVLVNRGGVTAEELNVPEFVSLLSVDAVNFIPEECPLCKEDIPINEDYGHGSHK